jgi:hypothetical protein
MSGHHAEVNMAIIGLVACCKQKCRRKMEAQYFYRSDLFVKSRQYINKHSDAWFILSAKHGLLLPSDEVEFYDESLTDKSDEDLLKWAERVWTHLRPVLFKGDKIVILAGEKYRNILEIRLKRIHCTVESPLDDMPIGKQLKWLKLEGRKDRCHTGQNMN